MRLEPTVDYPDGDYSNSEINKVLVNRFNADVFTKGRLEITDEILTRDFIAHWPGVPEEWQNGSVGIRSAAMSLRGSFPNIVFDSELVFARGGKVVVLWQMTGTHRGEFMGVSGTGESVTVSGTDIYLVSPTGLGGKIAELWRNWDQWGILKQIGVV